MIVAAFAIGCAVALSGLNLSGLMRPHLLARGRRLLYAVLLWLGRGVMSHKMLAPRKQPVGVVTTRQGMPL